jgi:drug/metabolite transporter (DMT)-like permease
MQNSGLTSDLNKGHFKLMAIGGLFLTTVIWGASFFLIKKTAEEVGVLPFLFWRFALASAFIILIFPQKFAASRKSTIQRGLILGALLIAGIGTQTIGIQYTTASKSGFITALYAPFVPLVGWFIFRQKVVLRQMAMAFVAVLGLYLLTDTHDGLSSNVVQWARGLNIGDLWTLASAAFLALQIVFTERYTRMEQDSIALGLWQFIGCFILLTFFVLAQNFEPGPFVPLKWKLSSWSSFAIGSLIFTAILGTCFGFIMQIICQKAIGSLKAALIFALEAPFAALFAFLFLGEFFTHKEFIGAVIVFIVSIIPEKPFAWKFLAKKAQ